MSLRRDSIMFPIGKCTPRLRQAIKSRYSDSVASNSNRCGPDVGTPVLRPKRSGESLNAAELYLHGGSSQCPPDFLRGDRFIAMNDFQRGCDGCGTTIYVPTVTTFSKNQVSSFWSLAPESSGNIRSHTNSGPNSYLCLALRFAALVRWAY